MDNKEMASDVQASLKLWDIRKSTEPVRAWRDASLCNFGTDTNVTLSSNERVLLTGSSVRKGRGHYALLHAYDTLTGENLCKEAVLPQDESLTQVYWCNVNNQVYIGSSSGDLKVLYSPSLSKADAGILACVKREAKRRRFDYAASAFQDERMIYYPTEIMDAKQREWELKNPEAAKRGDSERVSFVRPEYYE